jgi:hypothetical protein
MTVFFVLFSIMKKKLNSISTSTGKQWLTIFISSQILLFNSCNTGSDNSKLNPSSDSINLHSSTDTLNSIDTVPSDTDSSAYYSDTIPNPAFGKLSFGMKINEVNRINKNPQKLGKFIYNFNYFFNGSRELYGLILFSNSVKTIQYEDGLQGPYSNLFNIISIKYGKPSGSKAVPSIFEVMNAGIYWTNKWKKGEKEIKLGIRRRKQDSFDVICRIMNIPMEKAENKRIYRIKNKDILKAADKF